ncbi:MAG: hypothetical protein M3463_22720 [Verrucomicrobiota bacterium]|nr:hypothetical protein [Verrucomicrobiota bacterium]
MNLETAELYLSCHRPGRSPNTRVARALRAAERDDLLRARLQAQTIFDEQILNAVRSIEPPENLRQRLSALSASVEAAPPSFRALARHPAILSALAGALLIIGFLVVLQIDRWNDFPGRASAEQIMTVADRMTGAELEPMQTPAGQLTDWFYMHGFEGFALPAELSSAPTVGSRVFKLEGHPVAQLAIDRRAAFLYVFRASDFGVQVDEGRPWVVFTEQPWVGAIRQAQGICTLVALRGSRFDMERFLKELNR